MLQSTKEASLKGSLTGLFGLDVSHGHSDLVRLETTQVKRYTLSNLAQYFHRLMRDEQYAADVESLLESSGNKAYLVTGFLTTEGAL